MGGQGLKVVINKTAETLKNNKPSVRLSCHILSSMPLLLHHPLPRLISSSFFHFLHSHRPASMAHFTTTSSITPTAITSNSTTSMGLGQNLNKVRLRGVVFDMDGTLTVPVIDFAAMYKSVLGEEEYIAIKSMNPSGIDILHHIETWAPDKQKKAFEIIAEYERQGLDRLQIMPGAAELCGLLDSKQIRRGLITRNVKDAVDLFHLKFGRTFFPALSREFRPYKPDPAPLIHICSTWDVHPSEVMMIGDSLKDDVACGKRAGAFTCLLDETGRYDSPEFVSVDLKPDYKELRTGSRRTAGLVINEIVDELYQCSFCVVKWLSDHL